MAICTGKEENSGAVVGYKILENGKTETYCAEYLTTLVKTGKMTVENMKYDEKACKLVFTGDANVTVKGNK